MNLLKQIFKNCRFDKRKILVCSISFFLISIFTYFYVPVRGHWSEIFRPAAIELIHFRNPYTIQNFFNPPWALLPVLPFAILPEILGNALFVATTFIVFGFVLSKFKVKWYFCIAFFLLPQTLYNGIQVNLDWFVALGFLLPPQIGLFFVLIKPQIGVFLAIYWLVESWQKGGIKQVARTFAPVSIAFLLSFLVFGLYITKSQSMILQEGKNLWPFSIPFGLMLLAISLKIRKKEIAIFSSPLLTPYFQSYSYPIAFISLLSDPFYASIIIFGSWMMMLDPSQYYMLERLINVISTVPGNFK